MLWQHSTQILWINYGSLCLWSTASQVRIRHIFACDLTLIQPHVLTCYVEECFALDAMPRVDGYIPGCWLHYFDFFDVSVIYGEYLVNICLSDIPYGTYFHYTLYLSFCRKKTELNFPQITPWQLSAFCKIPAVRLERWQNCKTWRVRECEPVVGVWGQSPQQDPEVEPMIIQWFIVVYIPVFVHFVVGFFDCGIWLHC